MKNCVVFFTIIIVAISCNQGNTNDDKKPTTSEPGKYLPEKGSQKATSQLLGDSAILGIYEGVFPCNDCDGLHQYFLLKEDHTFLQQQTKWGKEESVTQKKGEWFADNSSVILIQNGNPYINFHRREDTLWAVTMRKKPVTDSLKYKITKGRLAGKRDIWLQKKQEGISFVGIGNEPFWNVELAKNQMAIKLSDWENVVTGEVQGIKENNFGAIYTLKSGDTVWKVTIWNEFCGDGMSDFIYRYKIKVEYKEAVYDGCAIMVEEL